MPFFSRRRPSWKRSYASLSSPTRASARPRRGSRRRCAASTPGDLPLAPRATRTTSFSSASKPMSARETSLKTTRSAFFVVEHAPLALEPLLAELGAEGDEHLAVALALAERRARCRPSARARASRPRRSSGASPRARRRAGSRRRRRRAARCRTSAARARRRASPRPSASAIVSTPGGAVDREVRGEQDDLGAAPARLLGERDAHPARRAVADEAHRVDRLARPAGGDEHALAGERSAARAAARRARRSPPARPSGPTPHSPSAVSPSSGPTSSTPRADSVSTFARVAGCAHIRGFIAGATSTGPAMRERRLGRAGCRRARARASRACSPCTARRRAGRRGSGARRDPRSPAAARAPKNVSARTNRSAPGVTSGTTSCPRLDEQPRRARRPCTPRSRR